MKRTALAAVFFAGLVTLALPAPASASVSWSVSVSSFHQTLAPYGRWVVAGSYGEVWVPAGITNDWEPYWDGEWLWTDYGWTWVSYDPWGDIPCHYGTWAWVDPYGWAWEPGTVWAPAWVTWAWTDDYIGWAPVPAAFGITVSGYAGPAVALASNRYVFVPATQFVGVNVQTVRVPPTQNAVIFGRAQKATRFTVSNGIVRTAGPSPTFVQRASGKRIERVSIEKARTRPTTLATAHVSSGKKISVVAPARERKMAVAQGKTTRADGARSPRARRSHRSNGLLTGKPARREPIPREERQIQNERSALPGNRRLPQRLMKLRGGRQSRTPRPRERSTQARAAPPPPSSRTKGQRRAQAEQSPGRTGLHLPVNARR